MNTILFPTDFSQNAKNAMHYALEIALKTNAELVLLNVCPIPFDFASRAAEAIEHLEDYSKKALKKTIETVKNDSQYKNVPCSGIIVTGSIIQSVLNTAKEIKAAMIILGTKGASGINRVLFGSNTAEIIRQSKVPVMAVPEKAAFKKFDKIVYAIDYKEYDLIVMKELSQLASLLEISCGTVHIATQNSLNEQIMHRGFVHLINDEMSDLFSSHELLIEKSFFQGMEEFLDANPGTLLAISHYKRPFIDYLLNNSITQELAYQIRAPLLIYNVGK